MSGASLHLASYQIQMIKYLTGGIVHHIGLKGYFNPDLKQEEEALPRG